MRNLKLYSLIMAVSGLLITSCENDFDNAIANPGSSNFAELAAMVRFESPIVGAVTLTQNISFTGTLVDPGNNVASYDLRVTQDGTNFVPFTSVSTFPSDLTITLAAVESALGTTIAAGNSVVFDAVITREDGRQFTAANMTGDTFNQGQRQAMTFTAFVSCPFVAADAAGTYDITVDAFGGALNTSFDATASGTTMVLDDPLGHGLGDMVSVEVDAETGSATIATQDAWDSGAFGFPYGRGFIGGTGFAFSCTGVLNLDLNWTVGLGSFGTFDFIAVKQ